jgi:two-component system cell cycle response regulator DivK
MPKTVMIVEDFADTRNLMKLLIQWYGYNVIEAADGYEAIEKSVQYHPDLILMDLALPIMDGVTATKLIRELEGFEKVSIVALTGFSNTSFDKAIEAGFDDVFVKPLHYENLEPLLTRYLSLNVVEKAQ